MANKSITLVELNNAIKVISEYKNQLEEMLGIIPIEKPKKINISQSINPKIFKVLLRYYKDIYDLELTKASLAEMDVDLLKDINYTRLRTYRGFGEVAEGKFREIMIANLVLEENQVP